MMRLQQEPELRLALPPEGWTRQCDRLKPKRISHNFTKRVPENQTDSGTSRIS